jgi:hypothetical protein
MRQNQELRKLGKLKAFLLTVKRFLGGKSLIISGRKEEIVEDILRPLLLSKNPMGCLYSVRKLHSEEHRSEANWMCGQ